MVVVVGEIEHSTSTPYAARLRDRQHQRNNIFNRSSMR
jgi:hypothetical protein